MAMSQVDTRSPRQLRLADPALAAALTRFVRSRVPPAEVDDIVQSTLTDALASANAPTDVREIEPWVFGIAKNKVADYFRRARRDGARDSTPPEDIAAAESVRAGDDAEDLLRWAQRELPKGDGAEHTLEWMLREGQGEKLETIAAEANVPAPRVRQRVARMRKHFRARWAAQLAAVAAVIAVIIAMVMMWKKKNDDVATPEPPLPAPSSAPRELEQAPNEADELRRAALGDCDAKSWQKCLDGLDAAKRIDPAGDAKDEVVRARRAATDALAVPPTPTKDDGAAKRKPNAPKKEVTPTAPMTTDTPAPPPAAKPKAPAPKTGPTSGDLGSDVTPPAKGDFKQTK